MRKNDDPLFKRFRSLGCMGLVLLLLTFVVLIDHGFGTDAAIYLVPCLVCFGFAIRYLIRYRKRRAIIREEGDDPRFKDLYSFIRGEILLTPGSFPHEAVASLNKKGISGSNALAALILELLECRNPGIVWALAVAQKVLASPDLIASVRSVISASGLRYAYPGRFPPEIQGLGKIGWTDQTEARIKKVANNTLQVLEQKSARAL